MSDVPSERSSHGTESATTLAPAPPRPGEDRFLAHLASAGELVAASRFREAEVEVLRALSGLPADLRALNLLALVRFKLGRLDDARATYREIAAATPNDAAVRRHLGLLALKLERVDEAITELEMAARLAPTDQQAWSYLGYAYTKKGEPVPAAAAFRRAGQDALANELENAAKTRRPATGPGPVAPSTGGGRAREGTPIRGAAVLHPSSAISPAAVVAPSSKVEPAPAGLAARSAVAPAPRLEPLSSAALPRAPISELRVAPVVAPPAVVTPPSVAAVDEPAASELAPVPLLGFVLARLGLAPTPPAPRGEALLLSVGDDVYVRAEAAVAAVGVRSEGAFRRAQGRRTSVALGTADAPFFRLVGPGAAWVAGAPGAWQALSLEDDILYVREDRVLAFDGGVSWEAGAIPGDGLRLLQFRGRGCVVLRLGDAPPTAVKVTEDAPALVSRARLLGWVGRVVTHKHRNGAPSPFDLICHGEGVVLFDQQVGDPERVPEPSGARSGGQSPPALGRT
ncbi:MAG TPA: tetratricopeptide repeat protein [Polyangia bacterium]|nr:tetratricopeptide repeat protein [Polyangia bacterium]